jgi:DnaK suppressor protein
MTVPTPGPAAPLGSWPVGGTPVIRQGTRYGVGVTESSEADVDRSELKARVADELERDQAQLVSQLAELDETGVSPGFDEGFADSAQVAAEQGESRVLASQLREQLDDVEAAIARLAEGTYGVCEVCGQPIADDRLEAMPATRWCIEHASS